MKVEEIYKIFQEAERQNEYEICMVYKLPCETFPWGRVMLAMNGGPVFKAIVPGVELLRKAWKERMLPDDEIVRMLSELPDANRWEKGVRIDENPMYPDGYNVEIPFDGLFNYKFVNRGRKWEEGKGYGNSIKYSKSVSKAVAALQDNRHYISSIHDYSDKAYAAGKDEAPSPDKHFWMKERYAYQQNNECRSHIPINGYDRLRLKLWWIEFKDTIRYYLS